MRRFGRVLACVVVSVGSMVGSAAKADGFGPPPWPFGFSDAFYAPGGPYSPNPYVVAGWGDDDYMGQSRYWGGSFWVDRRGYRPPYESYAVPSHRRWLRVR